MITGTPKHEGFDAKDTDGENGEVHQHDDQTCPVNEWETLVSLIEQ
jgi:hypothetical protein